MSILVLTSDTLIGTPATGNIEYNGQFFGTDSNASRAQLQRITQGTAVASTSGTSINFTGLPAWVKRITVQISAVSTSATGGALPAIQIGTSSGIETTGYISYASYASGTSAATSSTSMFLLRPGTAGNADLHYGNAVLTLLGSNTWVFSWTGGMSSGGSYTLAGGGNKTLSGTLDRVRITTTNGTDTFDAGSVNLLWEG